MPAVRPKARGKKDEDKTERTRMGSMKMSFIGKTPEEGCLNPLISWLGAFHHEEQGCGEIGERRQGWKWGGELASYVTLCLMAKTGGGSDGKNPNKIFFNIEANHQAISRFGRASWDWRGRGSTTPYLLAKVHPLLQQIEF